MSYDVTVAHESCPACHQGRSVEIGNYTYNCAPMLIEACGVGLGKMHGWPTHVVATILRGALAKMHKSPELYRAMNPANGWGDFDSWVAFLGRIADECERGPGRLEVH